MLKKILSLAVVFFLAAGAVFAFDGYIDVTNDTGFDIYYLYVSHESEGWGEDVLGSDILFDGETYRVEVYDAPSSIFDVRAEDEDGDTYTVFGIDIAVEDLTLTLADIDL